MARNIPKLIQTKLFLTVITLIIICPSQGLVAAENDQHDLATLIHRFNTGDSSARQDAAHKIWAMGPAAEDAVPFLFEALADDDVNVRNSMMGALCGIGKPAVPYLIQGLENDHPYIRGGSAYALGRVKLEEEQAEHAVALLIALLKDHDKKVCTKAASALGSLGPIARSAVSLLINQLQSDTSSEAREKAAWALWRIDAHDQAVVTALTQALKDKSPAVHNKAAWILKKIKPR